MFDIQLHDNVKLRCQGPDGTYTYVEATGEELNSQEKFYEEAYAGAWATSESAATEAEPKPVEPSDTKAGEKPDRNPEDGQNSQRPAVPGRVTVEIGRVRPGKSRTAISRWLERLKKK